MQFVESWSLFAGEQPLSDPRNFVSILVHSYVIHDVMRFQKTGLIYRDLSKPPPYLPRAYSPMVYVLYSLPGRIINSENPFLAPRLIVIAAFLACIGIVTSIVRTLIPLRSAWVFSNAVSRHGPRCAGLFSEPP
jgi:hypothetical protein